MNSVLGFICQSFRDQYQNEVIADYRGNLFTVRNVTVSDGEDGIDITLYDRGNGTSDEWMAEYGGLPYEAKEHRQLGLRGHDTMPTIISLAWDKKGTKTWVPIPSRYERDNKPHPLNLP